jgi:septum formation protein
MLLNDIKNYRLILASQSPRRHFLMREAGFNFEVMVPSGVDESFPDTMNPEAVPEFLAIEKAEYFKHLLTDNQIIIAADTIVLLDNHILGKPEHLDEAKDMLQKLSGRQHTVITGVCLLSNKKQVSFSDFTKVFFRKFSAKEIDYYTTNYMPTDKAGAYGAQEWIGYVGIEKIEGSYFNVMGLPIQKLYTELEKFLI